MAPPRQYLQNRLKLENDIIEMTGDAPQVYRNKARVAFYEEIAKTLLA
jgi:hypothetical protein